MNTKTGKKYAKLDYSLSSKQSRVNNSNTGQPEQKSKKMSGQNATTAKKGESENSRTIAGGESSGLGKRKLESSQNNKNKSKENGTKKISSSPNAKERIEIKEAPAHPSPTLEKQTIKAHQESNPEHAYSSLEGNN